MLLLFCIEFFYGGDDQPDTVWSVCAMAPAFANFPLKKISLVFPWGFRPSSRIFIFFPLLLLFFFGFFSRVSPGWHGLGRKLSVKLLAGGTPKMAANPRGVQCRPYRSTQLVGACCSGLAGIPPKILPLRNWERRRDQHHLQANAGNGRSIGVAEPHGADIGLRRLFWCSLRRDARSGAPSTHPPASRESAALFSPCFGYRAKEPKLQAENGAS